MDPMIDFVRDRTSDLQRVADDVRREREARTPAATVTTTIAEATVAPRILEPVASVETACCDAAAAKAAARPAA